MFTADGLLWRLKYFLLLVMIFAATSFLPASEAHEQTAAATNATQPDTTFRR